MLFAIRDQVVNGRTGAKHVHLHDDLADYTEAFFRESPEAQLYGTGRLEGEALIAARRKFAQEQARKSPAFTNTTTKAVHIYTLGTPGFVTIHEMIHVYTHSDLLNFMVMVEGLADYFAGIVCAQNGIPFRATYSEERSAMELLAHTVGDTLLANFAFHGTQGPLRSIVDLKGEGTWERYKDAVNERRYDEAAALLRGAKGIHEAKNALDDETARLTENRDKAERAANNERERRTWGLEGVAPIAMRPTQYKVVNGTRTVSIPRGGKNGVREGWSATLQMDDGTSLVSMIVALESSTTYVKLADGVDTTNIQLVMLTPSR